MIARYEARWRPIWGDWSSWIPVAGDASARDQTVEGLENGVKYTFEVRATNPAGAGSVAQAAASPRGSESVQVSYHAPEGGRVDAAVLGG